VGFVAEVLTNDDETALYQGPAQFQQLPEYIVNGAVAAPTASTAPPQGVVMQFPGSQSESEDPEAEEAKQELSAEEKAEKKEKEKQDQLRRSLRRTKDRSYDLSERMFELKRWIKLKAKELIHKVKVICLMRAADHRVLAFCEFWADHLNTYFSNFCSFKPAIWSARSASCRAPSDGVAPRAPRASRASMVRTELRARAARLAPRAIQALRACRASRALRAPPDRSVPWAMRVLTAPAVSRAPAARSAPSAPRAMAAERFDKAGAGGSRVGRAACRQVAASAALGRGRRRAWSGIYWDEGLVWGGRGLSVAGRVMRSCPSS